MREESEMGDKVFTFTFVELKAWLFIQNRSNQFRTFSYGYKVMVFHTMGTKPVHETLSDIFPLQIDNLVVLMKACKNLRTFLGFFLGLLVHSLALYFSHGQKFSYRN